MSGVAVPVAQRKVSQVLVVGFPVGAFQSNCYVLAPGEGQRCVIVDPGQDAVGGLEQQLAEHRLTPAGVLLTHGHFDHVYSAEQVCRSYGVPAWIHPDDRYMLTDPAAGIGPMGKQLLGDLSAWPAPPEVREIADGDVLDVAGLRFEVTHSPGHTGGSVLFGAGTDEGGRLVLAGDTLFAGAIGRTDMPGGDHGQMLRTLAECVLPMDDEVVVLPGHGPTTTIGRERAENPFLQGLATPDGSAS